MDVIAAIRLLAPEAQSLLARELEPNEMIEAVMEGAYGNAVIATDRRLLVFKKSALGGNVGSSPHLAGWRYPEIQGVELKKTMVGLRLTITAPPMSDAKWFPHIVMLRANKSQETAAQFDLIKAAAAAALVRGVPPPPTAAATAEYQAEMRQRTSAAASTALGDVARLRIDVRAAVEENLLPGEAVKAIVHGDLHSVMVATDRRVFVFKEGIFSGAGMGKKVSTWDYRNLSGVQLEIGSLTGVLALQGPGIPAGEVGTWDRGGEARKAPHALWLNKSNFADARAGAVVIRRLMSQAHEPRQAATAPAAPPDPLEQLRKLGELRDAGVLTAEEFEAKKTELLGRF